MKFPRGLVIPHWGRCFGRVEILLVLVLALSLYGEAFPYGMPLVLPITVIGFLWFAVIKRTLSLKVNAGFVLLILCFAFYLIAVIRTSRLYDTNRRELRNAVTVIVFSILLFSIRDLRAFQRFRDKAQLVGAVLGTALAILGLYKFHSIANGRIIHALWVQGYVYPWGTSLVSDYNFYALAMLCGAISCLYCLFRLSSVPAKVICILGFCLNAVSLSLSGSRRGWVTEALLLIAVSFLIVRWLLVGLLHFRGSTLLSTQTLKTLGALVIVAMIGPMLVNRPARAFLSGKRGMLEGELKDLELRLGTLNDPAESFEGRTSRWKFAAQLLDQGPVSELLLGRGFDYLPVFFRRFDVIQKDTATTVSLEDYPHNPLISAALYSGIPGSFVVLFFLLLALFRYMQRRKIDTYFLILYFASLWFILPSYDSIFSGKFFGFLLLIPWSIPQVTVHVRSSDLSDTCDVPRQTQLQEPYLQQSYLASHTKI